MKQCGDDNGTLASCARVSRAFSQPALEVLWEELDSMQPLFSILRKFVKIFETRCNRTWFAVNRHVSCDSLAVILGHALP